MEYDEDGRPLRLDTVVLSVQHSPEKPADELFWELTDKVLAPALQALPPDEDITLRLSLIHISLVTGAQPEDRILERFPSLL